MRYQPHLRQENNKKDGGLAALLVVVIVGAVSLTFIVGATLVGIGEIDEAYIAVQGERVFSAAEGCLEDTLQKLREDPSYLGASPPPVPDGSCIITVQDSGGLKDIVVEGSLGDYTSTISARASISGGVVTIISWRELSL